MSSNKSVRKQLERLYGKECFIEKLHLRNEKNKKYTSKGQYKRMKKLTYHHIKMRKDGGKSTIENGAILSAENHTWFHQQSIEKQEKINKIFQDYKNLVDECKLVLVDDLDVPYKIITTDFVIPNKERAEKGEER